MTHEPHPLGRLAIMRQIIYLGIHRHSSNVIPGQAVEPGDRAQLVTYQGIWLATALCSYTLLSQKVDGNFE